MNLKPTLHHRGNLRLLWFWTFLLPIASATWAQSTTPSPHSVAVVDFVMSGATRSPDTWAVGLCDLMAVELQQQAIPVFERCQIRLVLGERHLAALGAREWQQIAAQKLPQIRFLVSGEIHQLNTNRFHLAVALTEVRSGREVASVGRDGQYPADLLPSLKQLALELTKTIRKGIPGGQAANHLPPGFTRKPEIALLFYQGVEHCLAGRPEWAAPCFIEAQHVDPMFVVAKLWKWRAFQMLGIDEYVQTARTELLESAYGATTLTRLETSPIFQKDRITLALLSDSDSDGSPSLFTTLKQELQQHPGLAIFNPRQIDALTQELDLQLSENPEDPLDLATMAWTAVDELLHFRVADDGKDSPPQVIVQGRDALSSAVRFEVQAEATATAMPGLSRVIEEKLRQRRQTMASTGPTPTAYRSAANAVEAINAIQIRWREREGFAKLLQYTSQHPKDRQAIFLLRLCFPNSQPAFPIATWNRYIAAVDPSEPGAASLIAMALWNQLGGPFIAYYHRASLENHFAAFLRRYPDSLEAQFVRSEMGMQAFDRKDYAAACHLWTNLIEQLPRQAPASLIGQGYWINLYFFAAAASSELHQDAEADRYLRQAEKILQAQPEVSLNEPYESSNNDQARWCNHFPLEHACFGPDNNLRGAIARLRQRLTGTSTAPESSAISAQHLKQLQQAASVCEGAAACDKYLEFLSALNLHKKQHLHAFQKTAPASHPDFLGRQILLDRSAIEGNDELHDKLLWEAVTRLNQLMAVARHPAERRRLESLAKELADGLDRPIAARFYQAAGLYDQALAIADEALSRQPNNWGWIRFKASLLRGIRGYVASGECLLAGAQLDGPGVLSQLAHDAAADFYSAGLYERASHIYERLAASTTNAHGKLSLHYYRAGCEYRAGNTSLATELLREIVKGSEGRPNWTLMWYTYSDIEGGDLHKMAIDFLDRIRTTPTVSIRSRDWSPRPKVFNPWDGFAIIPPASAEPPSQIESDVNQILYASSFHEVFNPKNPLTDSFIQKHGRSAVPVLIKALPRHNGPIAYLLDKVVTAQDAPAILDAFRYSPELARLAFRLNPDTARIITAERFPVYQYGDYYPLEFNGLIIKHRLREVYPVLLARQVWRPQYFRSEIEFLDKVLTNDPEPETTQALRQSLATCLEKELIANPTSGLEKLVGIALKYGVPAGIEALLSCRDLPPAKSLALLRPFMDLPSDDSAAWRELEAHRGHFRWNAAHNKYESIY